MKRLSDGEFELHFFLFVAVVGDFSNLRFDGSFLLSEDGVECALCLTLTSPVPIIIRGDEDGGFEIFPEPACT